MLEGYKYYSLKNRNSDVSYVAIPTKRIILRLPKTYSLHTTRRDTGLVGHAWD